MTVLIGFIIGAVAGCLQFWLLTKFAKMIGSGKMGVRGFVFGFTQFLLPFAVLIGCAFLLRRQLLWAGIGIVAAMLVLAAVNFIKTKLKLRGRDN